MYYIFTLVLCISCWWFGRANGIKLKNRDTPLSTYKADPRSFYPSYYFNLDSEKIKETESCVEASAVITRERSANSIAKSVDELVKCYAEVIKDNEIKELKEKIALCHKAIKLEKESFLTDSGPDAAKFTMNRQNMLTDYLLTGIMIPMILGAINIDAESIADFCKAVGNRPILLFAFLAFLLVFSYRVFKYFWNKYSMLNDTKRTILYNKAELMLCAFETAVERRESSVD